MILQKNEHTADKELKTICVYPHFIEDIWNRCTSYSLGPNWDKNIQKVRKMFKLEYILQKVSYKRKAYSYLVYS